ncbi:MAG: thioredoxin family protein [Oscillatoriales cyanobacterium SM2_1_8]|nr:thioredoxin family protein [Oscillatoriales cyanobacterium SM2_1_8]
MVASIWRGVMGLVVMLGLMGGLAQPVSATLTDDRYDGNIFALYGGNGSLVPPRLSIDQSRALDRPSVVVYYLDDSADCKRFSPVLNEVQAFYSRKISIVPVPADLVAFAKESGKMTEELRFYRGVVPQTVVLNTAGEVVFDRAGLVSFGELDTVFQETLGLSPVVNPKIKPRDPNARQINEINP